MGIVANIMGPEGPTGPTGPTGENSFSWDHIVSGKNITIPDNQQMIVFQRITIDGILTIIGSLVLIYG